MKVGAVVTDGTGLLGLTAACTVFGRPRPEIHDPWYDFGVYAEPDAEVGPGWFRAGTTYPLEAIVNLDTIIVPSLYDTTAPPPAQLIPLLQEAYRNGARIASICTGAFALAAAGLLDDRRATTHWMHVDRLAREYPSVDVVTDVLYVDEGQILTSAGEVAGLDLCLHMLRDDLGVRAANAVARRLVAPPHRDGGQAQYVETPVPPADGLRLGVLLDWVRSNLGEPLTVTRMADEFHVSPRHLTRLFRAGTGLSPLQWVQRERVREAQNLLETTKAPIEHIAATVGIGTGTNLRRHFTRALGVPPTNYRNTFSTRSTQSG